MKEQPPSGVLLSLSPGGPPRKLPTVPTETYVPDKTAILVAAYPQIFRHRPPTAAQQHRPETLQKQPPKTEFTWLLRGLLPHSPCPRVPPTARELEDGLRVVGLLLDIVRHKLNIRPNLC